MLMLTRFDGDADIIDVPQLVIDNAEDYQEQFFKWLFDKSVEHTYWWYEDGEKYGCSYRSEAFIEWLNTYPLLNSLEKAKSVKMYATEYDNALPSLSF